MMDEKKNRMDTIKLNAEFILTSVTTLRAKTSGKKRLLALNLKHFWYILMCVNN
jgi:hypothetical protein